MTPKPTPITATDMHRRRGELLRRCATDGEHFVILKDGIPIVALIPLRDYNTHQAQLDD